MRLNIGEREIRKEAEAANKRLKFVMRYAVYADLSRRLTDQERSAVAEALDENVPDSGCVGPQKRYEDEVYFSVEAPSDDEASALAAHYMNNVIKHSGVDVQYMLALQTTDGGFRAWTPEM